MRPFIELDVGTADLLSGARVILASVEELGLLQGMAKHLWMLRQVVPQRGRGTLEAETHKKHQKLSKKTFYFLFIYFP